MIDLSLTLRRLALDSAFGWAIAKTVIGPAPAGVRGTPFGPRCWRVDPTLTVIDNTASSVDEVLYIGDTYLMRLDEARDFEGFDATERSKLQEWSGFTRGTTTANEVGNHTDRYATPMTRLIDIYLPSEGKLCTWPATMDSFGEMSQPPLRVLDMAVNPYTVLTLVDNASSLIEISTLTGTKALSDLANDLAMKTANQARAAKRNPVFQLGSDADADMLLNKPDGASVGLADLSKIGLYTLPGPDANVTNIMSLAIALFKQMAGNVDLSLGNSAVTGTARQEQILAERVSARENVNRQKYEKFAADIGRKIIALAFNDQLLELDLQEPVPGFPEYVVDRNVPAEYRVGRADEYKFDVVPYSTQYRSPDERISQLQSATAEILQIMQAKASGAPLNLGVIIQQISDYRDLPELMDWWSGEEPPPQEASSERTASMAPQGSTVRYEGVGGDTTQGGLPTMGEVPQAGGMEVLG